MLANPRQFAALVKLFKSGTKLTYRRGEYVIRPGEQPNNVFFIEEGLVKAYNISKYGEENLLIIRKDQEIFPLIWALTGQEREIIYQAISPTILWRIDREKYVDFLHRHGHRNVPDSFREITESGISDGARTPGLFPADYEPAFWQRHARRFNNRRAAAATGYRQLYKCQPRNSQPRIIGIREKRLNFN
jgi:hypothetical protein